MRFVVAPIMWLGVRYLLTYAHTLTRIMCIICSARLTTAFVCYKKKDVYFTTHTSASIFSGKMSQPPKVEDWNTEDVKVWAKEVWTEANFNASALAKCLEILDDSMINGVNLATVTKQSLIDEYKLPAGPANLLFPHILTLTGRTATPNQGTSSLLVPTNHPFVSPVLVYVCVCGESVFLFPCLFNHGGHLCMDVLCCLP